MNESDPTALKAPMVKIVETAETAEAAEATPKVPASTREVPTGAQNPLAKAQKARATIIFDFDGTLNDTMATYAPAFRLGYAHLVAIGYAQPREVSDEEIASWIGWSVRDMWNAFAPDLSAEEKERSAAIVGTEMDRLLAAGAGRLFPGIPKTLDALKTQGCTLLLLSNCSREYIESNRAAFDLDRWFDAYFCTEAYDWAPKTAIFPHIVQQFGSGSPKRKFIVVGDRSNDLAMALENDVPCVGCAYGYGAPGELARATHIVREPRELLDAIRKAILG